ncbi:protein tesmin/TSO1-like CXC 5-like [Hibiscus syriacus]|uniref:Protein tesmin/TSO1-like CXC 5-like n=1 Tax=Hibiscus syriacus TaxID=106335 RepID=A0A6A3D6Y8_HIBSY|nr:protein tesmin/TSO1-like CXC 5-like [Hibiscus syriacus]
MEVLLSNYVEESLNQYMTRNVAFLCERLFAEFPSEVNSQLLARCYLTRNQPHSAYYILKGMQMAQSRYLFVIACLEMDLFSEAKAALLPIEHLCTEELSETIQKKPDLSGSDDFEKRRLRPGAMLGREQGDAQRLSEAIAVAEKLTELAGVKPSINVSSRPMPRDSGNSGGNRENVQQGDGRESSSNGQGCPEKRRLTAIMKRMKEGEVAGIGLKRDETASVKVVEHKKGLGAIARDKAVKPRVQSEQVCSHYARMAAWSNLRRLRHKWTLKEKVKELSKALTTAESIKEFGVKKNKTSKAKPKAEGSGKRIHDEGKSKDDECCSSSGRESPLNDEPDGESGKDVCSLGISSSVKVAKSMVRGRVLMGEHEQVVSSKGNHVDADLAGNFDIRRSTTGCVYTLGGTAVSWVSQLQKIVALSTIEVEYAVFMEASKEIVWLQSFLEELGKKQENNCLPEDGILKLEKINGAQNPADMLTKTVPNGAAVQYLLGIIYVERFIAYISVSQEDDVTLYVVEPRSSEVGSVAGSDQLSSSTPVYGAHNTIMSQQTKIVSTSQYSKFDLGQYPDFDLGQYSDFDDVMEEETDPACNDFDIGQYPNFDDETAAAEEDVVDDNEEEVTTVNEHVEHPFCNLYNPEEEKEEE